MIKTNLLCILLSYSIIILYSLEPLPSSTSIKFCMLISYLEHQILRMHSMFVFLLYQLTSAHISWLVQAAWFMMVCCFDVNSFTNCDVNSFTNCDVNSCIKFDMNSCIIKDKLKVNSC